MLAQRAHLPKHTWPHPPQCPPLCAECSSTSTCTKCASLQSEVDWSMEVDQLVYRSPQGRCLLCAKHPLSSGCTRCSAKGTCAQCQPGFKLVAGRCQKCGGPRCTACAADGRCTGCALGFGLNAAKACVPVRG